MGFSIIPKDDRHQALRARRSLIAMSGYLVLACCSVVLGAAGFTRGITVPGILCLWGLFILVSAIPLVLISTGLNRRFKDPSLTVFQIFLGTLFVSVMSYFSSSEIRGINLLVYILVFVFGTFRLRMRDFIPLVVVAVAMYGGSIFALYHFHPEEVNVSLEAMRTSMLLMGLLWISFLASYIAHLRRRVRHMASYDALTNVYNRREIFEILEREKAFSDRTGIPFSLCILDIDDFKKVNDTYGHQAGDEVLRRFAGAIKGNIRAEDYVGRYGGEEFLVIFVNIDCMGNSEKCVTRLLEMARNLTFPDVDDSIRITVSIGATSYLSSESIDELIARADQALYEAKASGKNRMVCNLRPR